VDFLISVEGFKGLVIGKNENEIGFRLGGDQQNRGEKSGEIRAFFHERPIFLRWRKLFGN
jgi:hypothetical protein